MGARNIKIKSQFARRAKYKVTRAMDETRNDRRHSIFFPSIYVVNGNNVRHQLLGKSAAVGVSKPVLPQQRKENSTQMGWSCVDSPTRPQLYATILVNCHCIRSKRANESRSPLTREPRWVLVDTSPRLEDWRLED
jgi:hypothetical protein